MNPVQFIQQFHPHPYVTKLRYKSENGELGDAIEPHDCGGNSWNVALRCGECNEEIYLSHLTKMQMNRLMVIIDQFERELRELEDQFKEEKKKQRQLLSFDEELAEWLKRL